MTPVRHTLGRERDYFVQRLSDLRAAWSKRPIHDEKRKLVNDRLAVAASRLHEGLLLLNGTPKLWWERTTPAVLTGEVAEMVHTSGAIARAASVSRPTALSTLAIYLAQIDRHVSVSTL